MSNKLASNYHEQHGCRDCGKCFIKSEYDSGPEFFCCADGEKRPPCMSVEMGDCPGLESMSEEDDAAMNAAYDAWDTWSDGRGVKPWGICSWWEERHE